MPLGPLVPFDPAVLCSDAPVAAPALLGALVIDGDSGAVLRVIETEAYMQDDPASHSARGRTKRNAPMFGPPGHWYAYFVYGVHWCLNVVTGPEGDGQAVLLRAGLVERGWSTVARRRRMPDGDLGVAGSGTTQAMMRRAVDGPGKLAAALGVSGETSGRPVRRMSGLWLASDGVRLPVARQTSRVGISAGHDHRWRFCASDAPRRLPDRGIVD